MPCCVVKTCKNYNSKIKKSQGITYHVFPRDKNRKDYWTQIIRHCRRDNSWKPSSGSTVCSAHFDDKDFIMTPTGLRCLVQDAIPKKLLWNTPEITTQSASLPVRPPAPAQVPAVTERVTLTVYCRLCAAPNCNSNLVDVQSDNDLKKLVMNMSNRLNTNIDFRNENLPTTICFKCVKALYTAYDFVVGIDQAQITLNNITLQKMDQMPQNGTFGDNLDLSSTAQSQQIKIEAATSDFEQAWLPESSTTTSLPQVKIEPETSDFEQAWVPESSTSTSLPQVKIEAATSNCERPVDESGSTPFLLHSLKTLGSYDASLDKKSRIIDKQRKKLKILYQKIRRLEKRNDILKHSIIRRVMVDIPAESDIEADRHSSDDESNLDE